MEIFVGTNFVLIHTLSASYLQEAQCLCCCQDTLVRTELNVFWTWSWHKWCSGHVNCWYCWVLLRSTPSSSLSQPSSISSVSPISNYNTATLATLAMQLAALCLTYQSKDLLSFFLKGFSSVKKFKVFVMLYQQSICNLYSDCLCFLFQPQRRVAVCTRTKTWQSKGWDLVDNL